MLPQYSSSVISLNCVSTIVWPCLTFLPVQYQKHFCPYSFLFFCQDIFVCINSITRPARFTTAPTSNAKIKEVHFNDNASFEQIAQIRLTDRLKQTHMSSPTSSTLPFHRHKKHVWRQRLQTWRLCEREACLKGRRRHKNEYLIQWIKKVLEREREKKNFCGCVIPCYSYCSPCYLNLPIRWALRRSQACALLLLWTPVEFLHVWVHVFMHIFRQRFPNQSWILFVCMYPCTWHNNHDSIQVKFCIMFFCADVMYMLLIQDKHY